MLKRLIWLLLFLLLVPASGCRKGPDAAALQKEIQQKLDDRFRKGLFTVKVLVRQGTYPFQEKGDDRPRLLVYFKARLQFLRGYSLSDWNQLNATALANVLGATTLGVKGVRLEGNKKGDELEINGTSAYLLEGDKWLPALYTPAGSTVARSKTRNVDNDTGWLGDQTDLDRYLDEMNLRRRRLKKQRKSQHLEAIDQELRVSLKRINLRLDRLDGKVTFSSGVQGGEYHAIGEGLEAAYTSRQRPFQNYASGGSIENCLLVGGQLVSFGLAQNDIAHMAVKGTRLFSTGEPLAGLRAVCSLYPEAIQVVARADSTLTGVADLRNKRVDLGPRGSGGRINALQVLEAHGLRIGDLTEPGDRSLPNAIAALQARTLDAFFFTMAYPASALEKLAGELPIRFLSLDPAAVTKLQEQFPFYVPLTIEKASYTGLEQDVHTLGVTAMLVTHRNTADEQVGEMLQRLFDSHEALARQSSQANYITRKTARLGISIELHPGATRFFGLQ